jgi:hypothetical protein
MAWIPGLCRVGAVEPFRSLLIEIERVRLRVGIVDGVRRRRCRIAHAITEEHLICKAERDAVRTGAAQDWLVSVVADGKFVGK